MKSSSLDQKVGVKTQSISRDEFLTTDELMALLKIKNRKTIYQLLDSGMPKIVIGRYYRFIKTEVIEFLKNRDVSKKKIAPERRKTKGNEFSA